MYPRGSSPFKKKSILKLSLSLVPFSNPHHAQQALYLRSIISGWENVLLTGIQIRIGPGINPSGPEKETRIAIFISYYYDILFGSVTRQAYKRFTRWFQILCLKVGCYSPIKNDCAFMRNSFLSIHRAALPPSLSFCRSEFHELFI